MQHLDEGTIHAWLDGQLPREEAAQVEAHVAECRQCADAVAEARGLIAASSRILTALDSVPREVVPKEPRFRSPEEAARTADAVADAAADAIVPLELAARRPRRRWFNGASLAAAAAIVVAIGTVAMFQKGGGTDSVLPERAGPVSASAVRMSDSAATVVDAPVPRTAAPAAVPPATKSLGAASGTADSRQAAAAPSSARGERAASNEVALRRAATDSGTDRVTVMKESESRALYGNPAASAQIAIRGRSAAQSVDSVASKPGEQLAKDAKQEVRVAQQAQTVAQLEAQRREPLGATIARPDSGGADQSKQSMADAAPAKVAGAAIKGRVTDANANALAGASVAVAGTTSGVVTNSAGEFTISGLQGGTHRLTVRRVGYQPATRDITVTPGQTAETDVVLSATQTALSEVVVTSSQGAAPRAAPTRAKTAAPAPSADTPPGAAITAEQSGAVGCYDLGITPLATSRNTGFRQAPRRVALDSEIVPANANGVWYRARDLARTSPLPDGLWRPAGTDAIELEFSYGSRTTRIRVSGPAGAMMRGSLEEIDRATATGDAANVVAVRRSCEP